MKRFFAAAALTILFAGCAAAPDALDAGVDAGPPDAGSEDAGLCPPNLPPPSDPCLSPCGNERKVGQPCTKGGGECGEFHLTNAWLCTADAYETTLAFCTRPCVDDTDCGSGAVCQGDPSHPESQNKGCVPIACASTPDDDGGVDGGTDAGMIEDAGLPDGGDAGQGDGG